MTAFRERAPAKVNLTLEVAGRRGDGFHEIASLVAFARAGDWLTLDPAAAERVEVSGPFAGGLAGGNILDRALALIRSRAPDLRLGAVHLAKHLPIAAGLGGGSADAAALLRALRHANGEAAAGVDWHGLARELGADVPACLEGRPLWMTGAGHTLAVVPGGVPTLDAVLVNPMAAVPADKTAEVFRALGAAPLPAGYAPPAPPAFPGRGALLDVMRARGNHLARAAEAVVPEVGAVIAALAAVPRVEHVAVSGAGPTCFGIFADQVAADAACREIAAGHPAWWVVATQIG